MGCGLGRLCLISINSSQGFQQAPVGGSAGSSLGYHEGSAWCNLCRFWSPLFLGLSIHIFDFASLGNSSKPPLTQGISGSQSPRFPGSERTVRCPCANRNGRKSRNGVQREPKLCRWAFRIGKKTELFEWGEA